MSTTNTTYGGSASATGSLGTAVGQSASANADDATAIGSNVLSNYEGAIAVGQGIVTSAADGVSLGRDIVNNGSGVAIGTSVVTSGADAVVIGEGITSTANALKIGNSTVGNWIEGNTQYVATLGTMCISHSNTFSTGGPGPDTYAMTGNDLSPFALTEFDDFYTAITMPTAATLDAYFVNIPEGATWFIWIDNLTAGALTINTNTGVTKRAASAGTIPATDAVMLRIRKGSGANYTYSIYT